MTGPLPLGHIGRYELIARLATGGMGEVFLARVRGAGGFEKQVVIKRILPHLASDPGFVQRFIEEGKLVVKLRHASIAQVLDMGEEQGVFFIAMEHVDGKDLAELLRLAKATKQALPVPVIVFILTELLEALDYAHRATDGGHALGIIHRDVSPSNLLVSKTGEVKLVDFGIARATERLQASTTGVIRGKYGYMSPQQAAGAELDARSDLFSVGVVAWELLSGVRPFDGASDLLTLDRVRFHDPGPLEAVAPNVPPDLAALVTRLLAKSPDDRYASADEALKALRAHLLKSGQMASARDLAEWVERVFAELPPGLRGATGVSSLSLDDVLRLGLSDVRAGGGTVDAIARTPSAPMALAVTPRAIGSELVAGSPALRELASLTPAGPVTPATPSRKRTTLVALLIVLNLALIAIVLLLVLRPGGEPEDGETRASTAPSADVAPATVVANVPDTRTTSETSTTPEVIASEPPRMVSGAVFGGGLDHVAEALLAPDVEVTIRTTPPNASVTIAGLGPLPGSRKLSARAGTTLRLRVSAPEHQSEARTLVVSAEDPSVYIALDPLPRGIVKFRYLPANATVLLDGRAISGKGNNVLSLELTVGSHEVEIVAGDYRANRRFTIKLGETTNLGTIEL